jgi:hypothetical protein
MGKTSLGLLTALVLVLGVFASPLLASAQGQQVASTDKGTLKVGISSDPQNPKPGDKTKLKIDFINPKTNAIQEHIDYSVSVTKDGKSVFGPIPLTHTSIGTVTVPVEFKENGEHQVLVDVQGILFQPIPSEKATVKINIGQTSATKLPASNDMKKESVKTTEKPKPESKAKISDAGKKPKEDSKKTDDKKTDKVKKKVKSDKKPVKKPTVKPKTSGY